MAIINKELAASNALLRDTGRPEFLVNRVRDADSILRFSKHVTVHGWTPVPAQVQISNAAGVAGMLGGAVLYGDAPFVPLRELIQNATDSIRARRHYDKPSASYEGKILVRMREAVEDGERALWLDVEDDGVGMSERVLTGPLIDFGASLWQNRLVENEFPGLRGSAFRSSGRFGLGFYSVFTIASAVWVTSKRFDQGILKAKTLVFRNGLESRPLLLDRVPDNFTSSIQTMVSLRLKPEIAERFRGGDINFLGPNAFLGSTEAPPISLENLLSHLCLSLDVDVFCSTEASKTTKVHDRYWYKQNGEEWLARLLPIRKGLSRKENAAIAEAAARLSLIYDGDDVVGRAAISVQPQNFSLADLIARGTQNIKLREFLPAGYVTYGGLSSANPQIPNGSVSFWGVIESRPKHASRYSSPYFLVWDHADIFLYPDQREKWLDEQYCYLKDQTKNQIAILENFARFGRQLEGYHKLQIIRREGLYESLDDIEVVSVSDIGVGVEKLELLFPMIRKKAQKQLQAIRWFRKQEIRSVIQVLKNLDLEFFYFSNMHEEEQDRIPEDLADSSKYSGLLASLVSSLKTKGFSVEVSEIFLDQSALPKELKSKISALIKISAEKK